VEIHPSALKHGSTDEDILHVIKHQLVTTDLGDDDTPYRLLTLGPDPAGNILEVILLIFDDDRRMAIHAMPIRPKYLSLLPQPGTNDA
jgi:hypothetical protein